MFRVHAEEVCLSVVDKIEFYFFHHHHYTGMPDDPDRITSTWVDYPNEIFDPVKGHELYEHHLRMVRLAEDLGFDGITINEHHNTTYSMTPTVIVMAGAIAASTRRAEILVAGGPVTTAH